jgi:hypothetical protein
MFFEVLNHVISGRHNKPRDAIKAPLDTSHIKHFHVNTQAHTIVKSFLVKHLEHSGLYTSHLLQTLNSSLGWNRVAQDKAQSEIGL